MDLMFLGCGVLLERERRDECFELREREKSYLKTWMTGNRLRTYGN